MTHPNPGFRVGRLGLGWVDFFFMEMHVIQPCQTFLSNCVDHQYIVNVLDVVRMEDINHYQHKHKSYKSSHFAYLKIWG